ncbi:DUF3667 domain-containing protein [Undibacterium sp.]|uniref:DUF3667 domain-containing protein n=1 Tax=Undibacterium sp. TaxID=1914977 RepID=UPI003751DA93
MPIEIDTAPLSEAIIASELANGASTSSGTHPQQCANCGAAVDKAYCPECGQHTHIHHSLLHLLEELLHGLFHFDTKAWRTIPALMWRPGELTRNYVIGQRTRFVSPLVLFLFLIFLMFFVFSFTSGQFQGKPLVDEINSGLQETIKEHSNNIEKAEQKLSTLAKDAPNRPALEKIIIKEKKEITSIERILKATDGKAGNGASPFSDNSPESVKTNLEKNVPVLATPRIVNGVSHALQNPDLVLYKFKNTVSKFAFLLVPISLPFLWLLFALKRRHSMFEHAVFSLYSLSFMSILMMLCSILASINWYALSTMLLIFVPPVHIFRHLRGTYQLGVMATLWRTIALLFVAFISLLFFALIALRFSL